MDIDKSADILRTLGDKTRMQILSLLQEGEKCGNDILASLEVGQSTLSHHMKALCQCELVDARKEGKWTYYSLSPQLPTLATQALEAVIGKVDIATPAPAAPRKKIERSFEPWLL